MVLNSFKNKYTTYTIYIIYTTYIYINISNMFLKIWISFLKHQLGAIGLSWQTEFLTGSALLDHHLMLIVHVAQVTLP